MKLKVGIVGVGHLGKIHLRILQQLSDLYTIVGFYDPDESTAKEVEHLFGVQSFSQIDELLGLIDVLDIVAPTPIHFHYASKAAELGLSIFVEKPVVETLDEAEKLKSLVQKNGVIVQVGHVERFNPAYLAALPYFQEPMFIETHRLAMFNPRGTDVPVVMDLMIHDIDIILKIVNSKVKNVAASGVTVVSETPDIANARLEFENGCVANLTSSRLSLKNMRKSRFFQRNAYVSVDFLNKELEVVKLDKVEGEPDPFDLILPLAEGKNPRKLTIDKPDLVPNNAIEEELKSFYYSVVNKEEAIVTLNDGIEALVVAQMIMDKIAEFRPIL